MRKIHLAFLLGVLASCVSESAFLTTAQAATSAAPASTPLSAEFAVRWNPKEGGPASARAAIDALGKIQTDSDDYEVRYLNITAPRDAPRGSTAILRERMKGKKKFQLTFKYRSESPLLLAPDLQHWSCPLAGSTERKDEVDVSFPSVGAPHRAYSRSCTKVSNDGPVTIPKALKAKRLDCVSTMTRIEGGGLKVEEWHLPGKITMIEVSREGRDTPAELDSFRNEIVTPLVKANAKPADRSKTELGMKCKS